MGCQHVEFELLGQVRLGQLPEQSTVGLADGIDQQIAALDGQDIAEGFAGFRMGRGFDICEGSFADGHLAYIQGNDPGIRCAGLKALLSNHGQTVLIAADDDDIGRLLRKGQSQRAAKTVGSSADDGCSVFPRLARSHGRLIEPSVDAPSSTGLGSSIRTVGTIGRGAIGISLCVAERPKRLR